MSRSAHPAAAAVRPQMLNAGLVASGFTTGTWIAAWLTAEGFVTGACGCAERGLFSIHGDLQRSGAGLTQRPTFSLSDPPTMLLESVESVDRCPSSCA